MSQNTDGVYDFFIAHAGKDKKQAKALYQVLSKDHKVFLDMHSLHPGEVWAQTLSDALRNSRVILLMISNNGEAAYYFQEELARAIDLYRSDRNFYRVVPIYLDGFPMNLSDIPYGLYRLHSISFREEKTFENLVLKLKACLDQLTNDNEKSYQLKESLSFFHILHQYPEGPMVDGSTVPSHLIYAFAEFIEVTESLQVINEANAFRKQADPSEKGAITIRKIDLPFPDKNSPKAFWLAAFAQARLHGPRMLAALLLVVEDRFFPADAREAKSKILNELKFYSP